MIGARRWEYLQQIGKHQSESYLIVDLDEKWFDSKNTAQMVLSDDTEKCIISTLLSKGKWIVI